MTAICISQKENINLEQLFHMEVLRMGETVEKRLKDYKGFEVWKVTDNKATSKEEVTYMLNDSEGNNINCFKTLNELKQFADNYK